MPPKQNVTSNNELKTTHNNISKQISIAQEERQQVIILEILTSMLK